jgi:hypothetical protein
VPSLTSFSVSLQIAAYGVNVEDLDQANYFRRRAEEERAAADKAGDERAAQTHRALAARYDAKASGSPVRDAKDLPEDRGGGTLSSEFTILP